MGHKITVKAINAEMERRGFAERLQKANGYFFFTGGDAHLWRRRCVFVKTVGSYSIAEWIYKYNLFVQESLEPVWAKP